MLPHRAAVRGHGRHQGGDPLLHARAGLRQRHPPLQGAFPWQPSVGWFPSFSWQRSLRVFRSNAFPQHPSASAWCVPIATVCEVLFPQQRSPRGTQDSCMSGIWPQQCSVRFQSNPQPCQVRAHSNLQQRAVGAFPKACSPAACNEGSHSNLARCVPVIFPCQQHATLLSGFP